MKTFNSDNTGEEDQRLSREIASKNQQLKDWDARLADKDRQLTEITGRLSSRDQKLARIKNDLAEKSTLLRETQDALRQASESIASRDAELLRVQAQTKHDRLESDLARQKDEMTNMREKMESFERLFSQVSTSSYNEGQNAQLKLPKSS
jgi:chromosome segregation ATPase